MKTISITLYKFEELTKEAQKKAIEKHHDINVNFNWWESTYEDAKTIGLEIEGFDLDRNKHCLGAFIHSPNETTNLILENHGEKCKTVAIAISFRARWADLVSDHSDGIKTDEVSEDKETEFDQLADELENEFKNDLLSEYANILEKESEYLMSQEAIKETLISNEYDFRENGERHY